MRNKRKREQEDKKRSKRMGRKQGLRELILEEVERLYPAEDKPLTKILNKLGPHLE